MFSKNIFSLENIYWFSALFGSLMLLLQLALNLFGIASHHDIGDLNDILDSDIGHDVTGNTDSNDFKWLSKQAFLGFFSMFGWVGLSCLKEFKLGNLFSILLAFIAGIIAMFVSGFIFKIARKLQSPGTVFKIEDAIGKEAVVYQKISRNGKGKISLPLNNLTTEIEAISLNGEEISSFTKVKIINKIDDNTASVVSIK